MAATGSRTERIEHASCAPNGRINMRLSREEFDASAFDDDGSNPIDNKHHAIFECSGSAAARKQHCDLSESHHSVMI